MPNVNKHILIGHLGADPELKYTGGGTAVCNFSVATTRRWKDASTGEKKEKTDWHKVVVWGKSAEFCKERLAKGDAVYVEGRVETRSYEDRDGNKRYMTETVAESVQPLTKRDDGYSEASRAAPESESSRNDDDAIPF